MQDEKYRKTKRGCRTAHCAAAPGSAQVLVAAADDLLYRKQFHGGLPCPCDAGFIMTKGRMEKQGEHFCLHFLRGCAILLYTDECISPRAIVAQLDRAFGSDPEGQRFESSRSHQEKPRHNVPGLFFFLRDREDSNSTALRSRVSNQPSGLLLSARFPTGRNVYQQAALCPENRKKLLRVRPGGSEQHGPAQQGEQSAQWAVAQCAVPNR